MTHFYLTLPSNSSQKYFPNNTLTDYTTKLASTVELTNEWEVGLAEIMFPRSWCTIPKSGLLIDIDFSQCNVKPMFAALKVIKIHREMLTELENPMNRKVKMYVNGGFYHSMEELTHELNQAAYRAFSTWSEFFDENIGPPTFHYKSIAKRIHITVPSGMSIKFPHALESIIGLGPTQNPICNATQENTTYRGDLSCNLQAGIHALYVYCDLLQFTYVGDIKAPLLRVVDSGGEAGDVVTRYYERPRYIPLQKKNFDSIQIDIRDDLGEKIQFENGKVLLTLHFRRARNQYLL